MSIKKELLTHISRWKEKEIISSTQENLILKDLETESTTNNFFKIIATIGSLFIGIGIILIISSNWEQLPKFLKLILILAMPTAGLGIGYYLSYIKQDFKKIGDSLIMLSSLLIGASLALLGQLYNLDGTVASLLLKWTILTLPLTYIFRFKTLSAISISLLYITILTYIFDTFKYNMESEIIMQTFTFLPLTIILISYFTRKTIFEKLEIDKFKPVQQMFEIISIKVLLFTLLIGTIDENLYLLGETFVSGIIQHGLFLASVFGIMYFSNKENNHILRNSTFFWLGAFMIIKYFDWFWGYAETGLFFVIFGLFLLGLVYTYIKVTKNLDSKNNSNND